MTTAVLVDYIDQHRERFGVEPICEVLSKAGTKIAPSSYYAAKTRPPSGRALADQARLEVIRTVHAENYGVYGIRMVHVTERVGHCCGQRRRPVLLDRTCRGLCGGLGRCLEKRRAARPP